MLRRIGVYNDVPSCRKCGLHDETAQQVLFDCNGFKQERDASHGELGGTKGMVGRRVPAVELVWGTRRLFDLSSGLLT